MVFLCWILNAASLTAAGVVLTKQTPSESEAYWKPIEFGSIENYPTSVVITPKGTKQTSTITRYQIGVVIEFVDLNATSIVSEDQFNKFKAARDSLAGYASQCKQAAGILSAVVQNYDQVLRYYADGNVLIAGKWISKHDYEAKQKADSLAATAGSIPELVAGGKSFKNVRVTKVVGDRISIMHEGGIASLQVGELAEDVRMKLEITFPKQFVKEEKSVAATLPAPAETVPEPGRLPWESDKESSGSAAHSGGISAALKPLPLPEANGLGLGLASKTERRLPALDKKILERERDDILEAVDSIRKRVSLSKYNGGQDIKFTFDLETGQMSIGDEMYLITERRVYVLMVGDLDPDRIVTGTYRKGRDTIHYVKAFTINDAKTIQGFDLMERHLVRNMTLLADDDVDAEKNLKALHYLASIYRSTDLTLPANPLDKLNALLSKDEGGQVAAELIDSTLVLTARGKGSKFSMTVRVQLLDLDPEKFRYKNSGEESSGIELFCEKGKTADFVEDRNGEFFKGTTDTMAFPVVNSKVAQQIIEIITQFCIDAGWRKKKF